MTEIDETAVRPEVRAWLEANWNPDYGLVEWRHKLAESGWGVPHWPIQWGGTGWSPIQQYIFQDELQLAPAPQPLPFGVNMVGPVIYTFGTEAQKRRFLPRIANLDDWWCQGFSEPGSGSDLASLSTRAISEGDDYIVNGTKIWTSQAHYSDWMFCLVRTDQGTKPQSGITFLLFDLRTPGISVRPIISIDGAHSLNQVFFEDVRVPKSNRIGEENAFLNVQFRALRRKPPCLSAGRG